MIVEDYLEARGHPKIRGTHRMTFEVTKDSHLTERGDCVIGVRATKSVRDLSAHFKRVANSPLAKMTIQIEADGLRETARGFGHTQLSFMHPTDIVARKSNYVCGRTIMIGSDKAAADLSRELIKRLQDERVKLQVRLTVEL